MFKAAKVCQLICATVCIKTAYKQAQFTVVYKHLPVNSKFSDVAVILKVKSIFKEVKLLLNVLFPDE